MKQHTKWFATTIAMTSSLAIVSSAVADTAISTFDDFNLDGLFDWADATIVSGPTSYQVTDSGYGSGYKNINPNIDATGEKTIELTVAISGSPGVISGSIVSLVDGDGTFVNYAWYGRTAGTHVLTALLSSGSGLGSGTVPGLDLSTLDFFHLQDDPGAYSGQYTIAFENLRLTGAIGPVIISQSYNPNTHEFTLTWTSSPDATYTILHTSNLSDVLAPLVTSIASEGSQTTTTVILPTANAGFVRVQKE